MSGGPIPPTIPTQFTTDFAANGSTTGIVVPENNNVYVLGNPPAPVGTTGIVTQAFQTTVPNDTILVRFLDGSITTSDGLGQTRTIITINISNNSSFTLQMLVTAYETATGLTFGGRLTVIGVNNAGTVTIAAQLEKLQDGSGALAACSFTATPSGTQINLTVTGIAGRTIDWHAITPGIVGTS